VLSTYRQSAPGSARLAPSPEARTGSTVIARRFYVSTTRETRVKYAIFRRDPRAAAAYRRSNHQPGFSPRSGSRLPGDRPPPPEMRADLARS